MRFLIGLICLISFVTAQEVVTNKYTIDDFLQTRNYIGASFSPDTETVLVSSDISGVYNIYAIDYKGEHSMLTKSFKESIFSIGYFPQDKRFLYYADQGGNEISHIFVQELDGKTKDLTPGEKAKALFLGWSQDGESFFVGTNERNGRFFDLYEYNCKDYQRTLIYENEKGFFLSGISADKNYIALSKIETRSNSDIFLFDRKNKKLECITTHEGDIFYQMSAFHRDSKHLYYLTDEDSEFKYVVRYHILTKKREVVYQTNWDVLYAVPSEGSKYLLIGVNNDGKTQCFLFHPETMKPVSLPDLPNADISSVRISSDETKIAFYASNSKMPKDLFVYDFVKKELHKLTNSLNEKINANDLVAGSVVRFDSFDGVSIPGILYQPHGASEIKKAPALVWVHGGPGGQSRIGYRPLIQYLVNHGYVIYAINNRGSSGYGKTFYKLDDRNHGKGDLQDCIESKKMLVELGFVDPEKIGIIGGSYGGFMVLAALAFTPEEFTVGVDIFGVSNWVRTLQNIPPWWAAYRKALEQEMGDFDDTEYLKSISPLFHADKIKKPLMVLQGANDPRVLKVESDEIVNAVRKNGVAVQYIIFEDEGHGFRKKKNQKKGFQAIRLFLDNYLKK